MAEKPKHAVIVHRCALLVLLCCCLSIAGLPAGLCCLASSENKFKNPPSQALRSAVIQALYAWFSVDSQCAFLSANKADLAPAPWCGALRASDNIADRLNLCACFARLCSQAAAKSGYPETFGNLGFQANQVTPELQVATFHIETLSNLPALSEVRQPEPYAGQL